MNQTNTHGLRKPRRPKYQLSPDTMLIAMRGASKLSIDEVAQITAPITAAFVKLRRAQATMLDWSVLAGSITLALRIEAQGVVRGLDEHLQSAAAALQKVHDRAMLSGQWRTTCLYAAELEAIDTGLDLHRYQLEQLSQRELVRALESAEGDVRSNGGLVVNRRELEMGVAA